MFSELSDPEVLIILICLGVGIASIGYAMLAQRLVTREHRSAAVQSPVTVDLLVAPPGAALTGSWPIAPRRS